MITYVQGNLLESNADVLVNTVNTVGVMGKGIALMFKDRFANNFQLYSAACKSKRVRTGEMFVTQVNEIQGPKWIVNFPTKEHWRSPAKMTWIIDGLQDLRKFLLREKIASIAIPPLGAGNGGLRWEDVREEIEFALSDLNNIDIILYEPTDKYQNVSKREGVEKLTPARALIAELVRRYWVLGMECSLLEIQKLAWFLERSVENFSPDNPLDLKFNVHKYGPYANRLDHLLNNLDGSYLHCDKRIGDAGPLDVIWFDAKRGPFLDAYLNSEAKIYSHALERVGVLIDGFESPFGMELLATIDWLITKEGVHPTVPSVREGLKRWPAGAGERKMQLFDDQSIEIALQRLSSWEDTALVA